MHSYIKKKKSKTCAMFSVLPSCLAANVCADAPNPRSSLSDPCSSASDEWKECLLECRGDLINDTSDSQRNIYSGIHYIFHLFVVTRNINFHLHNIKGLRPSVALDYCNSFTWFTPKNPSTTWNSCRFLLSTSSRSPSA